MTRALDNEAFVRHAQARLGVVVDGWAGPQTRAAFDRAVGGAAPASEPPWITVARSVIGLHEVHDNAELRAFLRSDGRTLGDPAALPWCGDYVETCIRNALPAEVLPGALGENPYWARNWALFGRPVPLCFGAILAFERGQGGHVGFAVGDDGMGNVAVLGANQSNAINIMRLAKSRLLPNGIRWPLSWAGPMLRLPRVAPAGPISINEV